MGYMGYFKNVSRAFSSRLLSTKTTNLTFLKDGTAHLQLASSPVNALSLTLLNDVHKDLETLKHENASAFILSSAFPHVFSAGLDIHYLLKKESDTVPNQRLLDYMSCFQQLVHSLLSLEIPTAAVISGAAPAGGTVLSLCCDYRIASTQQKFSMGFTEVFVGMAPPVWVYELAKSQLIPNQVFPCLELGKSFTDPKKALEIGFLHELAESPQNALQKAQNVMEIYKKMPTLARSDIKKKSRKQILDAISESSLMDVYHSITGDEFQRTATSILQSLKKKKN